MTRVLVAYASHHESTSEIARVVADSMAMRGFDVDCKPASQVKDLESYNALVIGSAVYMGRMLSEGVNFVLENEGILSHRLVWLFTSGPIGDPPSPQSESTDVVALAHRIGAIGHHVFGGQIELSRLDFGEKMILGTAHTSKGDYRNWHDVLTWAADISGVLSQAA